MKANELMIGDWVLLKDCDGICDIITGVIERGVLLDANSDGSFEDIEPIPLTAEILEKNGWKWNRYHTSLELVVGTIHVGWGFYPNCISVSDWAENGDCQITSLRCEFVHQLQHALRLCGIDKEIVL